MQTPRWTHFGARLQPLTNQNPSAKQQQHHHHNHHNQQSHQTKRADVTNQGQLNQQQQQQQQQQQMDSSPEALNNQQQSSQQSSSRSFQSLLVGLDEDVMLSLMRQAELANDDFESDQPRQQQSISVSNSNGNGIANNNNENNNRVQQQVAAGSGGAERRNSLTDDGQDSGDAGGMWMSAAVDPLVADLQFRNAHIHKVDDSDDQVRGQPQTNNKFRKQRTQWNHKQQQQPFAPTSGAFINPAVHHQRAESSQATR